MKVKRQASSKAARLLLTSILFILCSLSVRAETIVVTELTQTALQNAITGAASGDIITFNISGTSRTLTFTSAIVLDKDLEIDGTNLDTSNTGTMVFDGNNSVRLFIVNFGKSVTIKNVTMQNGYKSADGGAIYNNGNLTVVSSTFSGNSANRGGAITNSGSSATLTIASSTFSGNSASSNGGAIYNNGGSSNIINSLLVSNYAGSTLQDIYRSSGTVNLYYSIYKATSGTIATTTGCKSGATVADVFANVLDGKAVLDSDGTFHIKAGNATLYGAKLRVSASNVIEYCGRDGGGSYTSTDITTTLTTADLATDQLGVTRDNYSTGAYRVSDSGVTYDNLTSLVVNTLDDVDNPADGLVSLREAVARATSTDKKITFNISGSSRTIKFTSTLTLDKDLEIECTNSNATNTGNMVFDGGNTFDGSTNNKNGVQLFIVSSGKSVTIKNVTMQNGYKSDYGSAIYNKGTLTIASSTFSGNSATSSGGAIYNYLGATLTVVSSTFSGNSASYGGAIYNKIEVSQVN